jgi:hypothetical protein
MVHKWFERFRCGAESTEDEQRAKCRKSTKWFKQTED